MTQFVSEIIDSIQSQPNEWRKFSGDGLHRNMEIIIWNSSGWWLLTTTIVSINGTSTPITASDVRAIDKAVRKWYKTISLNTVLKEH